MNQPTAQFYRVITDNQVPFRLYAGQQDNSTVSIPSRTFGGGIGHEDYFPVGGGESAHIAFDPEHPRLIYATTINGTLTEYDDVNKRTRPIKPYPEYVFGQQSKDLKYRTNWNAPVVASPHNPEILYYGTQKLLRSDNRGVTWTEISPDLTFNDKSKQGLNGGPLTPENVGAEFYGTIFYIAESTHTAGVIWVATDDGRLQITRNGGDSWVDVTPRNLKGAQINAIEVSPHEPGVAYIAVAGYKMNDFEPYIYKLTDFGKRWMRLDSDLPDDNFVRVVRADPEREGLLYAGSEGGLFVSFDDGDHWQSLNMNFPTVPITDLRVRQNTLIAATQGRGFWALDELTVIRQLNVNLSEKRLHVFKPKPSSLMRWGGRTAANEGKNPPSGVVFSYFLAEEFEGPLSIDIRDTDGTVVRTYSSEERDFDRCVMGNMTPRLAFSMKYPPMKPGLNQWTWDMRKEGLTCIDDIRLFAGFSGPTVTPGQYSVSVRIGDHSDSASFALSADPRVDASPEDYLFLDAKRSEAATMLNELLEALDNARIARARIEALVLDSGNNAALKALSEKAVNKLNTWENLVTQTGYKTYEDEDSMPPMLDVHIRHVFDVIDRAGAPVSEGSLQRLSDLREQWLIAKAQLVAITESELSQINEWAQENNVLHVAAPID